MGDYPTEAELTEIEGWSGDVRSWLTRIRDLWWNGDFLVKESAGYWCFSTGGWSGNEDLVAVASKNLLWTLHWERSSRGGHYEFKES